MVLQRDKPVTIRGTADKGKTVEVTFAGQALEAAVGPDGTWTVTLAPLQANAEGTELVVRDGKQTTSLKNVVVGDVILFARQTSIDIRLGRDDAGRALANAHPAMPGYRAMTIHTVPAADPASDLSADATAGWFVLDAERAATLSAAAYHLGRDLAFTPSFGVGWYVRGRDRDLGNPVVFRSGFQLGLRVEERLRLGFAYHHLSNWRLGEKNPGAETFLPVLSFPVEELR